jgi:hypothetical protein
MGNRKQDRAGFLPRRVQDKLNAPPHGLAWCWLTQEIMESGSFRALSIYGRRVLDRIMLEHMRHAGQENGRLKVTWCDFVKSGISRRLVGHALGEVISAGLVAIEIPGRRIRYGQPGDPTHYRLTWLPVAKQNDFFPATNDWKRFGDDVDAARKAIPAKTRKGNGYDETGHIRERISKQTECSSPLRMRSGSA